MTEVTEVEYKMIVQAVYLVKRILQPPLCTNSSFIDVLLH